MAIIPLILLGLAAFWVLIWWWSSVAPPSQKPVWRLVKALAFISTLAVMLWGFMPFLGLYTLYEIWADFKSRLQAMVALNGNVVNIIAVIMAITVLIALRLLFSWNRRKSLAGLLMITGVFISFQLLGYYLNRNHNFSVKSTDPTRCCAENINREYEYVSCESAVHPASGKPVKPCNVSMIRAIEGAYNRSNERIYPVDQFIYFDEDGNPLIYYYRHPVSGELEFYAKSGRHPRYNVTLIPVTGEIVKEHETSIRIKKENANLAVYKSLPGVSDYRNNPGEKEASIILSGDPPGTVILKDVIDSLVVSGGYRIVDLFDRSFSASMVYRKLISDQQTSVKYRFDKHVDVIVVCVFKISQINNSRIDNSRYTASANLNIRFIRTRDMVVERELEVYGNGQGITKHAAVRSVIPELAFHIKQENP